ncbi:MAG: polysaccharide deacetylase family protein [Saprospiraceae bacterium]
MYLVKTPNFIRNLFPNFVWNVPTQEKTIFLTFDDGPIPEVTPWVLSQLEQYRAHATFFCVGDNIRKHYPVFEQVKAAGHALGSHTFNHLSGWASDNIPYFHNVRHCARQTGSTLFRPPYGRLKPSQAQFLQRHYQIVMWDILSGDFDPAITPEQCLTNVTEHAVPGSIIVFHDSLKARENLMYTLPRVLEHFAGLGYAFEKLDELTLAVGHGLRKTA